MAALVYAQLPQDSSQEDLLVVMVAELGPNWKVAQQEDPAHVVVRGQGLKTTWKLVVTYAQDQLVLWNVRAGWTLSMT